MNGSNQSYFTNSTIQNFTTKSPIFITITSPSNNSVNDTGYINVTARLDREGVALLNWEGINESMDGSGTRFYKNKTGLLSGNYSFKVYAYANESVGFYNVSKTRIATVDLAKIIDISSFIDITTGNTTQPITIMSPDGNVTVTLHKDTNATLNGNTLNNITIDSIKQIPSSYNALSGNYKFAGENLTLGPDGSRFIPDIQLRFNYTDAQLAAAGITESSLKVNYYNTTSKKWEALIIYHSDPILNYIIVNVSHFSTFALVGTPSLSSHNGGSTSSGGSSSSSGGGGSGGAPSDEDFANIEMQESRDAFVHVGAVVYRFATLDILKEIGFDSKKSEGLITAKIELLRSKPKKATYDAPGSVYRYFNVVVGTSGYGTSSKLENAYIVFRVPDDWLKNNNIDSVKLMKFMNDTWIDLKTEKIGEDTYKAFTPSFSGFAIIGTSTAVQATPAVIKTSSALPDRQAPQENAFPIMNLFAILGMFLIVVIAAVIQYIYKIQESRKK